MNCPRYIFSIAVLLIASAASAQDYAHTTLNKWRYPEPTNNKTIKYTEEDYYLFIADSLKPLLDSYQPAYNRDLYINNGKEPFKEPHSSDKAASSFYLKEY